MTNGEFYYLILVIATFATFGASMAFAMLRYRQWAAKNPDQLR